MIVSTLGTTRADALQEVMTGVAGETGNKREGGLVAGDNKLPTTRRGG